MKSSSLLRFFFISLLLSLIYLTGYPATAASQSEPKIFIPSVSKAPSLNQPNSPGSCLTAEENKLGQMINAYRASVGLPAAPLSKSLTMVAQYHVQDLQTNFPTINDVSGECNMHSWSDKGFWSPVCYTRDHSNAEGMWFKPKEITRGIYTDYGYEIASGYWGSNDMTAKVALDMWQISPGHNDVIIEQGDWSGKKWPAMGIGISKTYAVVWFSTRSDPQGTVSACQ